MWFVLRLRVAAAALALAAIATDAAAGLGSDLALVTEFCLYADCNARQAWVAHEWGQSNAATLVEVFDYSSGDELIFVSSGSWFGVEAGDLNGAIGSGSALLALAPVAIQFNYAAATIDGAPLSPAGTGMDLETTRLTLSVALDLERSVGIKGLSVGIIGYIPLADQSLTLGTLVPDVGEVTILDSRENVAYNLSAGVLWETGEKDWLRLGAYLNAVENDLDTAQLDLATGSTFSVRQTSNLWFSRVGTTLRPLVPAGLAAGDTSWARFRSDIKLSADLRIASISVPGEGVDNRADFFAGIDTLLLPDHWNPLAGYLQISGVAGVGTDGSWGAGMGIYGRGALQWLFCDASYSRSPGRSLGDDLEIQAFACAVWLPFPLPPGI